MKGIALLWALAAPALAAFLLLRGGVGSASGVAEFSAEEVERILRHSPLGPPPADPTNAFAEHPGAAALGQRLFFDVRLSRSGKIACATCHDPARGLADGEALSSRFPLDRHVPSLWNAAYQRWYFWDGRADSLWSQALKPLENPDEHGWSRLEAAQLLRGDGRLRTSYETVFGPLPDFSDARRFPPAGGPLADPEGARVWAAMRAEDREEVDRVFARLGKSIAAFGRRLVSRRAPFDVFVEGLRDGDAGKLAALSPEARRGLKLFMGRGNCRLCHVGPAFTDGEFHDLGLIPAKGLPGPGRHAGIRGLRGDPFNGSGPHSDARAEGARKLEFLSDLPETWGQFKTPSLRNVARTAPYMHQGQFATLRDVVRFYSTLRPSFRAGHQESGVLAPLRLDGDEIDALVAFLESLSDADPALPRPPD
ncbi:MAG TPA: cytochrome c peroxidase [Planctomycetota bacterium]